MCYYPAMTAAVDPQITWAAPFLPDDESPGEILWPAERHRWGSQLVQYILDQFSQPGDLVVDPFASQPILSHAASAGRRRLVLNNASPADLLGVLASAAPPGSAVVDRAFSQIADAPRRGRTLAHHLAALYETVCPECAQSIAAEHFVWDRAIGEPVEKGFRCPHCNSAGVAPADMVDASQVASLEVRGAAYWGLLSRLVKPGDPLTAQAREMQDLYPPRALLVISELLTAAEQRLNDSEELRAARAMILHVLSRGLSLHDPTRQEADSGGVPVRSLTRASLPRRFIENNLWLAFEHAYRVLRERPYRPLLQAADLVRLRAPDGEGRSLALTLHTPELAQQLEPASAALIVTEPPAFEPIAYALQFLWTGWLYGREAANRQRNALTIEQWSWDWYTRAMAAALRSLRPVLRPEGRLMLAFGDSSARRGLAILTAAGAAGWRLVSQATQAPLGPAAGRCRWRFELALDEALPAQEESPSLAGRLHQSAQEATHELLAARAEPAPPALVQTACAVRWSELGLLAELARPGEAARRPITFLLEQMRLALSPELPPPGLTYTPGEEPGSAGWWNTERQASRLPLADRVELHCAQRLADGPAPASALIAGTYAAFPGWLTPDAALLAACLASYSQPDSDQLRLRAEDQPQRRAADLAATVRDLCRLGKQLGFQVWLASDMAALAPELVPDHPDGSGQADPWAPANIVWLQQEQPAFAFAVVGHAVLHPWLQAPSDALAGCPRYVALPGGRAGLLDFKLRRCPPWRARLAWTGWEFVKFRHLRDLASMNGLNLASFRARIGLDPVVTLPGRQLALFDSEGDADDV